MTLKLVITNLVVEVLLVDVDNLRKLDVNVNVLKILLFVVDVSGLEQRTWKGNAVWLF